VRLIILIILFPFLVKPQVHHLFYTVDSISRQIAARQLYDTEDLFEVDSMYMKARDLNKGDLAETFLSLTFAVIPYNKVPIRLPLIHTLVVFPLISSVDSIFRLKNRKLPSHLFFDTPKEGDNDKNAHFFGSAFISYSSNIFDLGDVIGYFVEVFEASFEVQNQVDPRDMEANTLGQTFGRIIKKHKDVLPSQVMILKTLYHIRMNL
jgi:hypothetical protein